MGETMAKFECPQCDAVLSVPEKGLTMSCEYCGHSVEVPGADKRRKALEKEAAHRRRMEEREADYKRKQEEEKKANRRKTKKAIISAPGKLIGSLIPFIGLIIPAVILFSNGMFDAWIGDSGDEFYRSAATQIAARGFLPASGVETEGVFSGDVQPVRFDMQPGYCYAFVVGGGVPIRSVELTDPMGNKVANDTALGNVKVVEYRPSIPGLHSFRVFLAEQNGRYTHSLYYGTAPPVQVPAVVAPPIANPKPTTPKKKKKSGRR